MPPTPHTITIDIKDEAGVKRIDVSHPTLQCKPSDTVTFTGTGNVGRWAVAFVNRQNTPFTSNQHYFTQIGAVADTTVQVKKAKDSYDYYVFCQIPTGTGADALFLDPKVVIQDSGGGDGHAGELRAIAVELGELTGELTLAAAKGEELKERSLALAREIEEGSTPPGGQSG